MSKKNKKKGKKNDSLTSIFMEVDKGCKKSKDLDKKFKKALNEIEDYQMKLIEVDKMSMYSPKERRKANKKQEEFYTEMNAIKKRQKMAKKWEDTGFLDQMMELLHELSPLIKALAKALCCLIISFLSLEMVQKHISTKTLNKLSTVFNIAKAV